MRRPLLLLGLAAAVAAQYPVWSTVPPLGSAPTSLEVPPPGCSCVDGSSPCTRYDCTCVCNLKAGACDVGCCCDPDCSPTEVAETAARSACLPSGPANRSLRSCLSLDVTQSLVFVNPKPRMVLESALAMDSALCIQVDNSALAGSFFKDPGLVSASQLSQPAFAPAHSYVPPARPVPYGAITTAAVLGYYAAGERVAAAMDEGGGSLRGAFNGWWALPAAGADGVCGSGPGAFAAFRRDVPPTQCRRAPLPLTEATCEAWGGDRLLTSLRLALVPGFDLNTPAGYAAPLLTAVWVVADPATGVMTRGNATDTAVAFSSAGSACSCSGVVTSVAYRAFYNGLASSLLRVEAEVVVTTVTDGACAAEASAPLSWSLTWVDATSTTAGTAPELTRSGAPGYQLGAPVLGGALFSQSGASAANLGALGAADKVAVARGAPAGSRLAQLAALDVGEGGAVAGLSVRGAGPGGACVSKALLTGADPAAPVPITFGEDMALSCTLRLTPAEFNALCSSGDTADYWGLWAVNASGAPATPTHVGQLGNADPWKYWQWVAIDDATAPGAHELATTFASCASLATSFNVRFVWAYVGEARNAQAKILAVQLTTGLDAWVYSREDARVAALSSPPQGVQSQTFTLSTTVTWVQYPGQAPGTYVAPPPLTVPKLPADLWYPFGQ